jgi:hypothetical protein
MVNQETRKALSELARERKFFTGVPAQDAAAQEQRDRERRFTAADRERMTRRLLNQLHEFFVVGSPVHGDALAQEDDEEMTIAQVVERLRY